MKANELRDKTTAELEAQLTPLKKDIARVKTILRERELRTEA